MNFHVLTLFPDMIRDGMNTSIIGRAIAGGFLDIEAINIKELNHETFPITTPFVAILPTYLEGGNGIDSGDVEILTNPLGDFIAAHENYKYCFGIIGSGNRNFNKQYCLTAKQYAKRFGFPMLGDFELRGTSADIERLAKIIVKQHQGFANPS